MSSVTLQHISSGIVFVFPSILTPAITAGSGGIYTTKEVASWIAGVYGISSAIGFTFLPSLMQIYGRRFINILCQTISIIGSVTIALAPNVTTLIVGRFIHGLIFVDIYLSNVIVAEYCHPKRRGTYIVIKIISLMLGISLCHSLNYSITWRQMAWLTTLPSAYGGILTLTWPESPAWLAYKGRFNECLLAFELLRGRGLKAIKEVEELITAQQELRNIHERSTFVTTLKAFRSKEFLRPLFLILVLDVMKLTSGAYVLQTYIMEIMTNLTGDKNYSHYFVIVFDVMQIMGLIMCTAVERKLKRRTLLFSSGITASLLMALICLFDYLYTTKYINVKWISPLLLILHGFVCKSGVFCISLVIKAEIIPLKYRGICITSAGIVNGITKMLFLKFTANMLVDLQVYGTLFVYLVISVSMLLCLYYILPETKDRTLQNIEIEFLDLNLKIRDDIEVTNKLMK